MLPHDHFVQSVGGKKFATVLAGPPWRFHNKWALRLMWWGGTCQAKVEMSPLVV